MCKYRARGHKLAYGSPDFGLREVCVCTVVVGLSMEVLNGEQRSIRVEENGDPSIIGIAGGILGWNV